MTKRTPGGKAAIIASGIGSAAIAAALLYAGRRKATTTKKGAPSPDKPPRKS